VGGTVWLWSPEKAFECLDVLFIDEAGQMSLADVLACHRQRRNWCCWGPAATRTAHEGEASRRRGKVGAEHLLNGRKDDSRRYGILSARELAIASGSLQVHVAAVLREQLGSDELARARVMEGHPWVKGAGMWFVPVEHEGNRSSSAEKSK